MAPRPTRSGGCGNNAFLRACTRELAGAPSSPHPPDGMQYASEGSEALLHGGDCVPQPDCQHENAPPRLGPLPQSALAGFRFPARGDRLGGPLVAALWAVVPRLEELLTESGVEVDHVTVYRWVLRCTPLLAEAARPCRPAVGDRWSVDETYTRVAGQWRYVYRTIDQSGQVIDVFIAPRRDATAARRCFARAIGMTKVRPVEVTTDRAPVCPG